MLMRIVMTSAILLIAFAPSYGQEQVPNNGLVPVITPNSASKEVKDPSSYALGLNIGGTLANDGLTDKEISIADFLLGIKDGLSKSEPKLTRQQMQAALMGLQKKIEDKMLQVAKANADKAEAYLEANKKKDGVQVTKSGLQYVVLKSGNGKQPVLTSEVTVHYEGKLIEGTVFDSSLKRNEPAVFPVSRVIKGWTEILQRMKVGDKWVVTIPPALAYGEAGSPPNIGPNECLIFEMELLDVK